MFTDKFQTLWVAGQKIVGSPVNYAPGVGDPVDVYGVFDLLYEHLDLGHAGVSSVGPAVYLTIADLPSDPKADKAARITINGTVYKPREAKPDGFGGTQVLLFKA